MAFFDMPLAELQVYKPNLPEPTDFDRFWQTMLENARHYELYAEFEPYNTNLKLVDVFDVTFSGYGGQRVKGWYIRPSGVSDAIPCVVEYIGYGGGRGFPHDWLVWANAGYAVFVMDTRGQGSSWRQGDTPDLPDGANPFYPGFMTQGIMDPETYYYARVYVDAVRAVEAALTRDDVDPKRIAVTGGSQGGGLTIAAAGLHQGIDVAMPDVPFLCHFRRSVGLTDAFPYHEIVHYLRIHHEHEEKVFNTLDYFDGMNFAARMKCDCLFSTSLMDDICPPSTVFAAYNHVSTNKDIRVYRFNMHEGGGSRHLLVKLQYLNERWG